MMLDGPLNSYGDCLLKGDDEAVADWVAQNIPHMAGGNFGAPGAYKAIGVMCSGTFAGGVVFHDFHHVGGKWVDVRMSGAFVPGAPWGRPSILRGLFHFPFVDLGARRMTTITGKKNKAARKADEVLGFKLEGTIRHALDGKQDAMIYGMLREECRFIPKELRNGK